MVANKCPFIDTRNKIFCKELQESHVVFNDLNILAWIVLKSNSKLNKILNEPLANFVLSMKIVNGKGW